MYWTVASVLLQPFNLPQVTQKKPLTTLTPTLVVGDPDGEKVVVGDSDG